MSRIFGPIRQSGYVVRDIDSRMRFMAEVVGIGPWFVAREIRIPVCVYRGRPIDLVMHAALANSGSHQIELIQQVSPGSSLYTEWLDRYPDGGPLQHVSSWAPDFDATIARATAAGWVMVHEGRSGYGPFGYLEHPTDPQTIFEVAEYNPARQSVFEQIAEAARDWDGADPIRESWPKAKV